MIVNPNTLLCKIGGNSSSDRLAWIMSDMGIEVSGNEDMDELISLLKNLLICDRRVECFTGSWVAGSYQNEFGFLLPSTIVGIDRSTFKIGEINKITEIKLVTRVIDVKDIYNVEGTGWTVERIPSDDDDGETVIATYHFTPGITRFIAYEALGKLRITAIECADTYSHIEAIGETPESTEDNETPIPNIYITDEIRILFSRNSWESVEYLYPTWNDLEGENRKKSIHLYTVTLYADNWDSDNKQTVTIQGIEADETIQKISWTPSVSDRYDCENCGMIACDSDTNSLTFSVENVPTRDLTVYVTVEDITALSSVSSLGGVYS